MIGEGNGNLSAAVLLLYQLSYRSRGWDSNPRPTEVSPICTVRSIRFAGGSLTCRWRWRVKEPGPAPPDRRVGRTGDILGQGFVVTMLMP